MRLGRPADGDVSQNVGTMRGRQKLRTGLPLRLADGTGKALAGVVGGIPGKRQRHRGWGPFQKRQFGGRKEPCGQGQGVGYGGGPPGGYCNFGAAFILPEALPFSVHHPCLPPLASSLSSVTPPVSQPLSLTFSFLVSLSSPPTSGTRMPPSPLLGHLRIHSLAPFLFISQTGPNLESRHKTVE